MEKIVVDSSIVIKWFVAEPLSDAARRVLDGYQSGALTLIAPDLLAAEIGNIVWKKYRFQGLVKADAEQIIPRPACPSLPFRAKLSSCATSSRTRMRT